MSGRDVHGRGDVEIDRRGGWALDVTSSIQMLQKLTTILGVRTFNKSRHVQGLAKLSFPGCENHAGKLMQKW